MVMSHMMGGADLLAACFIGYYSLSSPMLLSWFWGIIACVLVFKGVMSFI